MYVLNGPPGTDSSNSEILIDFPVAARDVKLVQIFLLIVPADSVQCVLNLKHHCAEGADSRQVSASFNTLAVGVVDEARIGSVLAIESAEDQDGGRADLVRHGQVAGDPGLLIFDINCFPNIFLDIVCFADVGDLFRRELDAATEDVDELGVEDAAGGGVACHIELRHAYPLIDADVVVLARLVEVLGVVAADDVDAIFFGLVDGREVRPRVVEVRPVLELFVLLDVLEHPVAAHVVLVATGDAEEAPVVTHHRSAELGNVVFEVDEVLGLLVRCDVVEVDVLVAPFEVVDDALVCQLLLDDENVLEEVDDSLLNIKVIELGNHGFLVLQVALVLINERIALVNHVPDVVEHGAIGAHVHLRQLVRQILVLLLLSLQLVVHVLYLDVVALKLAHNQFLVLSPAIYK